MKLLTALSANTGSYLTDGDDDGDDDDCHTVAPRSPALRRNLASLPCSGPQRRNEQQTTYGSVPTTKPKTQSNTNAMMTNVYDNSSTANSHDNSQDDSTNTNDGDSRRHVDNSRLRSTTATTTTQTRRHTSTTK